MAANYKITGFVSSYKIAARFYVTRLRRSKSIKKEIVHRGRIFDRITYLRQPASAESYGAANGFGR